MTTRSLILHDYEVRAALDGRLGLVVRPVKPQPTMIQDMVEPEGYDMVPSWDGKTELHMSKCPLGVPGDRLVCKETWCNTWPFTKEKCPDGPCYKETDEGECGAYRTGQRWRSPATMPAWASRITLDVVGVRCVRVKELTEDDARACGFSWTGEPGQYGDGCQSPFSNFEDAWNARYAKRGYAWDSNPWAWAVEVRRVEP